MSSRGTKRAMGVRGEETSASKRRRTEPEDALWQLRPVSDLKMSSIYNRSASEAPAELFRKDLISAMKLPDSEPLTPSEYWIITDTWKQDWERGVQVPVNPDSLPAPKVKIIENILPPNFQEFKLPKDKYIHLARDAHYQAEKHLLSTSLARSEAACSYDLDATDSAWLKLLNAERARAGAAPVSEDQLEKVIEELEIRSWDKIQAIMKSEEGLGIEYDENVICDVCRSPDSEDGNEMVFCDSCNICVHQACYGITVIPDGQWLCRPCGDGVRPTCVLCPNLGGAMKCTPLGHKWAHVSCVLWIPEVSIGCAEKMEPITKISSIPSSRWSLVCVLCRERKGACIQCSVKTCKTAYHVTCAFKHGLEMRAIIEDENADDGVKLRSYCQKHSVNSKKEKCPGSGSEEEEVKRKRRKDMTSEEKSQARTARLQEIEREFDRHVSVKDISTHLLDVDQDAINYIYNYWKLKRRAGHNRHLLPPKSDDSELLTHKQEQADIDKMKMFVQLRQDLERVRNLCYMVSRREKLSRSFFRIREQTFHKQVAVLSVETTISGPDLSAIVEANHGPSIYDRLYSHPNAPDHKNDFEELLKRIAPQDSSDEKKKDRNGLTKSSKMSNPYKKHYVNGSRRSSSMYSGLSSEESAPEISRPSRYRNRAIGSSTDEDIKKPGSSPKKKVSPKTKRKKSPKKTERKKKKTPPSRAMIESSSEDESSKLKSKKEIVSSKTLQQLEEEMAACKTGQSGTDSDELMPIRSTRNSKFTVDIYSDSSEDDKLDIKNENIKNEKTKSDKLKTEKVKPENSPSVNDSQQPLPRTKAAMKEFVPTQPENKSTEKSAPKKRGRKPSNKEKVPLKIESDDDAKNKENIKFSKQKDNPSDLIVPQRQAAKKASENMRSTTAVKKEDAATDKQTSGDDTKIKPKIKSKGKEEKDKDLPPANMSKKKPSKEIEPIAYVPQRQAAKKAAANIKGGLGNKAPVVETIDQDKKKEDEKSDLLKTSPKKDSNKASKTSQKESSCSSSTSSCSNSSSSSSSSDEEEEKPGIKPTVKAREIKPALKQSSIFSPPSGPRPTVDLPFLDKVSRQLSSTSASGDSDSSQGSRFSDSGSPTPKRPRRRRKGKSLSTDTSPRKAPDKKLKTSERGSECRVSSPPVEGEESCRTNDARAATRARTRSTTSSGNMPNKSDTRQRKPSKDETEPILGPNKTPKESSQPSELPTTERKADEEVKNEIKEVVVNDPLTTTPKQTGNKRRSISFDDKDKNIVTFDVDVAAKVSPRKSIDSKPKLSSRRASIKEQPNELPSEKAPEPKDRKLSKHDSPNITGSDGNISPVKKVDSVKTCLDIIDKKDLSEIGDDFHDKNWIPKAPSPTINVPPIEKPGGHEKYMTEDKSLDSDCTDKSSIKMIARIQANLNENTMIKSPKTPMDARTISLDPLDVDNSMLRIVKKRSTLDSDKKYVSQDSSHVQGVEISKSAKIPSALNQYPNRSILSPQPKDNELFELDMLTVDDGLINLDDMINRPTELLFKEDSKEQGVQETRNLVDRLRMQLSSKKVPSDKISKNDSMLAEKDHRDEENNIANNSLIEHSIPPPNTDETTRYDDKSSPCKDTTLLHSPINHISHIVPQVDMSTTENLERRKDISMPSKWPELPPRQTDIEQLHDNKYEQAVPISYTEENKESIQTDLQSEKGDTLSVSKQSDDSQSLSVVDHSIHSNDHDLTQDNQTFENNNSLTHSDCPNVPSPYVGLETKWGESKITTRRSSASSTNSEESVCSQKTLKSNPVRITGFDSHQSEMEYPSISTYAVETPLPLSQYSYPTESSYLGPLSLFPSGPSVQLSLPSPASTLYSGFSNKPPPLMQPKSSFATLCATFTTSSQNIALTTAMIAPPTPKPVDSPRDDIDVTGSDKFSIHVVSSPSISIDSYTEVSNSRPPNKTSTDSNDAIPVHPPQESKSPIKPVKLPSKFPGKSPGKSPISPKSESVKSAKRPSNKNNRSQRGRGRSKSRGQVFPPIDCLGSSIQSKLVGTVYDFDEEIANDGVDLKALRERRKSIDVRDDRKSEQSYKDSSQSPHVVSPQQNKKPQCEVKEVAPPLTPDMQRESAPSPNNKASSERGPSFSQVAPVLPGPVDMRTYQPFDNSTPVDDAFHSHLLDFASGTADQQLIEIDEEDEKQLHTDLIASKLGSETPTVAAPVPQVQTPIKETPRVSLSDSRNQLKVKIKGPFLDANYSTSSVQPTVPQPPAPIHDSSMSMLSTSSGTTSSMMSGSTNLRRMRKKELLRQYWTQDMNMDNPTNTSTIGVVPPPAAPAPLARAVITIPKAVASMTSIPTREDYKIIDSPTDKKKRKTTSGLSRELRHLEVSMNDDVDLSDDVKLSSFSSIPTQAHKRRGGRVSNKPSKTPQGAPKLKIKIGSNIVQQVHEEPTDFQYRPPKKRLTSIPLPSMEDIRRDSMKYRRKVMADFEEHEKPKKHKPSKSEKHKKKKEKKLGKKKLQVINNESESSTKLIIKIKRTEKNEEEGEASTSREPVTGAVKAAALAPEPTVDPYGYDPSAQDPLAIDPPSYSEASSVMRKIRTTKVTPIRLKLSRKSQGSGYVMKEAGNEDAGSHSESYPTNLEPTPTTSQSLSLTVTSKHCEVR